MIEKGPTSHFIMFFNLTARDFKLRVLGKSLPTQGDHYGFSKCSALNKEGSKVSVDTWHCKRGIKPDEKIIKEQASGKMHLIKLRLLGWMMEQYLQLNAFVILLFSKDGSLIIDFNSILKTKQESELWMRSSDVDFTRASNEVAESRQIIPITYALMKAETKMELQKIGRKIKT